MLTFCVVPGEPSARAQALATAVAQRARPREAPRTRKRESARASRRVASPYEARRFDEIAAHVSEAAAVYQVPVALLLAVIRAESKFNGAALSRVGAVGLMQLMRSTAGSMGVVDVRDLRQNILGGARYLRLMLDRWKGNYVLAIASYNAGPGAVARYRGVPPYRETTRYVRRVTRYLKLYEQRLARGGS